MLAHTTGPEPGPLLFNVSQLLKSDIGHARVHEFRSDRPLDLDGTLADEVSGDAKFTLTNFGVVAHVHASGCLHLDCSRCLDPFQTTIATEFEEEFVPSIDIQTGLPSDFPRSDLALPINRDHTIDLGEAIRQEFLLAMDLIPVCSADCKGLCATCGANLNSEPCACPPPTPASPFSVLVDLIGPIDTNES